jgi:hypothetical protein
MVRLLTIAALLAFAIPATETFQLSLPSLLNTRTQFPKLPALRPRSGVTALNCLSENDLSRRQVVNGLLLQIVAAPLIQPVHAESYVINAPAGRPRNVIITGANSGELAVKSFSRQLVDNHFYRNRERRCRETCCSRIQYHPGMQVPPHHICKRCFHQ